MADPLHLDSVEQREKDEERYWSGTFRQLISNEGIDLANSALERRSERGLSVVVL